MNYYIKAIITIKILSLQKIIIKTTKLNSSNVGSNAFKGLSSKTIIKVPKKKLKAYKKLFKKKGFSGKVK